MIDLKSGGLAGINTKSVPTLGKAKTHLSRLTRLRSKGTGAADG